MIRKLEVCVDSLASARAAIAGGADRLELCSALAVGGLTPFCALLQQLRQESDIEIRCMIRPRPGDFLYTPEELTLMEMQIRSLKALGADGFVTGCLTPEGTLDKKSLLPLMNAAEGSPMTLHRAADVSRNLIRTYRDSADMGFRTFLTSGGAASCTAGMESIGQLLALQQEIGGPEILIGAGVSAGVIAEFRSRFPTAGCFHMSGKAVRESKMIFRRTEISMGLPGLDEWHLCQTDAAAVQAARQALDA